MFITCISEWLLDNPVKNGETAGTEGQGLRVDGLWVTVTGKGAEVPEGPNGKSVDPTRPMVALTFDDGPSKYTPRILDSLEANGGRATFFHGGQPSCVLCVYRKAHGGSRMRDRQPYLGTYISDRNV